MSSNAGYIVMNACEDFEQVLRIDQSEGMPSLGVLTWVDGSERVTVFLARSDARAAITRTAHYAKVFGVEYLPDRAACRIVPVQYYPGGRDE